MLPGPARPRAPRQRLRPCTPDRRWGKSRTAGGSRLFMICRPASSRAWENAGAAKKRRQKPRTQKNRGCDARALRKCPGITAPATIFMVCKRMHIGKKRPYPQCGKPVFFRQRFGSGGFFAPAFSGCVPYRGRSKMVGPWRTFPQFAIALRCRCRSAQCFAHWASVSLSPLANSPPDCRSTPAPGSGVWGLKKPPKTPHSSGRRGKASYSRPVQQ